jgi:hypothetical protein
VQRSEIIKKFPDLNLLLLEKFENADMMEYVFQVTLHNRHLSATWQDLIGYRSLFGKDWEFRAAQHLILNPAGGRLRLITLEEMNKGGVLKGVKILAGNFPDTVFYKRFLTEAL